MHTAEVIAMGYRYPGPTTLDELATAVRSLDRGGVKRRLTTFIDQLGSLNMGEWEELHTATLDLSPLFVPYVGHVVWGENYRRGEFMADLNAAMKQAGIDLDGELPDHIAPVLRFLAVTSEPPADLMNELPGAVVTMARTLAKAGPKNPYRHLLDATVDYTADLTAGSGAPFTDLRRRRTSQAGVAVQLTPRSSRR